MTAPGNVKGPRRFFPVEIVFHRREERVGARNPLDGVSIPIKSSGLVRGPDVFAVYGKRCAERC